MSRNYHPLWKILTFSGLLMVLSACGSNGPSAEEVQATISAGVAGTASALSTVDTAVAATIAANTQAVAQVEPTWTVEPTAATTDTPIPPPATSTPLATATEELPTITPAPTETAVPADTPIPQNTQPPPPPVAPTTPPNPTYGADILPNGSFEDGWYNQNGISELQLPNGFGFEFDLGPTGFGNQDWDQYYRPETRVWPDYQIPPAEQGLFLQDGNYTIKIFKGNGPISFRFFADVALQPGTYLFRVRAYPDLVESYNGSQKVFSGDPTAGEIRFISPSGGTGWILPAFGQWNVLEHSFTLTDPQTVRIGVGVRSRYGLQNNGWVFDNWDLQKLEGG